MCDQKQSDAVILIADDELGPRESLKLILEPSYKVVEACSGDDALEKFEACVPDVVVSDIRMPGVDGIELMKRVKNRRPEVPFILLTGFGTLQSAQEAVRARAFDYISKPYNVAQIREVISAALKERQSKSRTHQTLQQLQTMNSQLEAKIRELDQKAAVGDLSAEMIHDLNNPIGVLTCAVSLLEDALNQKLGFDGSEEQEVVEIIKEQLDRCTKLTQKFLDYSRPSKQTWSQENVNDILQDTLFVFRIRMRHLGIDLDLDLAPELPAIWLQSTPMQQVFYNLITNAIQAIEDAGQTNGRLSVKTELSTEEQGETDQGMVVAVLSDNGPGIPSEIQAQIFEPFYTTKPKDKGTGLGLSICKRIVVEHGGTLQLASEPEKGTTFRVSIPVRIDKPATAREPAGSASCCTG